MVYSNKLFLRMSQVDEEESPELEVEMEQGNNEEMEKQLGESVHRTPRHFFCFFPQGCF